jgi:hypothetical protein
MGTLSLSETEIFSLLSRSCEYLSLPVVSSVTKTESFSNKNIILKNVINQKI